MPVPFNRSMLADVDAGTLRAVLSYDPETGVFTRIVATSNVIRAGDVAGGHHNEGYVRISVGNRRYLAHRLAWLYMTGEWPSKEIDHINGVRSDNRWVNLREATSVENNRNRHDYHPFKGTCFHKPNGKWNARLKVNGKHRSLGYYHSREEAHAAYVRAAREVYGKFASIPEEVAA